MVSFFLYYSFSLRYLVINEQQQILMIMYFFAISKLKKFVFLHFVESKVNI